MPPNTALVTRKGERLDAHQPLSSTPCPSRWRQICIGSQTGTLGYANAAAAKCEFALGHEGKHHDPVSKRWWTDQEEKKYRLCHAKVNRLLAVGTMPDLPPPHIEKSFRAYEDYVLGLPEKGVPTDHSVGPVDTIRTQGHLEEVLGMYLDLSAFVFDVETRGIRAARGDKDKPALDTRTNEVWCLSLAGPYIRTRHVIPMGHPSKGHQLHRDEVFEILKPLFFSDRLKINQNVGFDLLSIAKYYDGQIPPPPYADVMTMVFLINENLRAYNLGALAQHYLGFTYVEKLGEAAYHAPWRNAMNYSLTDARVAWNLWTKMSPVLKQKPKLGALFDLEMGVLQVLLAMKQQGTYVDQEGFHRLYPVLMQQREAIADNIRQMVGHPINLNSTQQLGKWLYKELGLHPPIQTAKGLDSTSAKALKILARKYKAPRLILEYKDVSKMLSTYVAGFIPTIDTDSRIRASFNQARAKTGRLSCSAPNLQNIPARYRENTQGNMIRQLFVAPAGKVLIVADYSQIELRILAHQTRDKLLLYAYQHGLDLHTQTASLIYKVPQDEVDPEQRSIAKNSNFNLAFEGGPGRIMDMSGISLREAEKVYDAWHRAYPGVKKWGGEMKRFCLRHGYVETLYGRKRRLKDISSYDNVDRHYAERQAVNHPIQGTAADIAKIGIIRVHEALEGYDAALTLQIHDEFIIEVAEEQVDEVIPLVKAAMEGIKGPDDRPVLDVPLEVNIGVGKNWSEAK